MGTEGFASALDGIYAEFKAGRIGRASAVRRIRGVADITDLGAQDLLDHPQRPSQRYEDAARATREAE